MTRLMLAACLLAATAGAWAHGGGLNADGCHNDRKRGGYHCHRGGPQPAAPALSRPLVARDSGAALAPDTRSGATYRNCSEARAAGAAPVRRGDPGYGSHLDRDGDGVGCE